MTIITTIKVAFFLFRTGGIIFNTHVAVINHDIVSLIECYFCTSIPALICFPLPNGTYEMTSIPSSFDEAAGLAKASLEAQPQAAASRVR